MVVEDWEGERDVGVRGEDAAGTILQATAEGERIGRGRGMPVGG
jgi:hypothetical protein